MYVKISEFSSSVQGFIILQEVILAIVDNHINTISI